MSLMSSASSTMLHISHIHRQRRNSLKLSFDS